jgi:hypothetical protein
MNDATHNVAIGASRVAVGSSFALVVDTPDNDDDPIPNDARAQAALAFSVANVGTFGPLVEACAINVGDSCANLRSSRAFVGISSANVSAGRLTVGLRKPNVGARRPPVA